MNVPELQAIAAVIAALAALLGGLYAIVTRPLLKAMDRIETRLDRMEAEQKIHGERLASIETELKNHSIRLAHLEDRIPPLVLR